MICFDSGGFIDNRVKEIIKPAISYLAGETYQTCNVAKTIIVIEEDNISTKRIE